MYWWSGRLTPHFGRSSIFAGSTQIFRAAVDALEQSLSEHFGFELAWFTVTIFTSSEPSDRSFTTTWWWWHWWYRHWKQISCFLSVCVAASTTRHSLDRLSRVSLASLSFVTSRVISKSSVTVAASLVGARSPLGVCEKGWITGNDNNNEEIWTYVQK